MPTRRRVQGHPVDAQRNQLPRMCPQGKRIGRYDIQPDKLLKDDRGEGSLRKFTARKVTPSPGLVDGPKGSVAVPPRRDGEQTSG